MDQSEQKPRRVAFIAATANISVASMRYRAAYPALALEERGWRAEIVVRPETLAGRVRDYDALVVVKHLGPPTLPILSEAEDCGVPAILDLCDDILNTDYRSAQHSLNRMLFAAASGKFLRIVTTGETLSEELARHGAPRGLLREIPDCMETPAQLAKARVFVEAQHPPKDKPGAAREAPLSAAQPALAVKGPIVVWFGNHGGAHSDFGLLTLLRIARELKNACQREPFTLVVISNDREKYEAFIPAIGAPSVYVPWSHDIQNAILERSAAFVMPVGEDGFSRSKSSNRALLALERGVPVVAESLPSLAPLRSAISLDEIEEGLVRYLTDRSAAMRDVARGREIMEARFSLAVIGQAWARLIEEAIEERKTPARETRNANAKLLVLIDAPERVASAIAAVDEGRRAGLETAVVVFEDAARASAEALIERRIAPTMMTKEDLAAPDFRWLRSADALILPRMEPPFSPPAAYLDSLARSAGMPVFQDAATASLRLGETP